MWFVLFSFFSKKMWLEKSNFEITISKRFQIFRFTKTISLRAFKGAYESKWLVITEMSKKAIYQKFMISIFSRMGKSKWIVFSKRSLCLLWVSQTKWVCTIARGGLLRKIEKSCGIFEKRKIPCQWKRFERIYTIAWCRYSR